MYSVETTMFVKSNSKHAIKLNFKEQQSKQNEFPSGQ